MGSIVFAIVAALLSGVCFYFSNGIGEVWALAWVASLPVLWLAYGQFSVRLVALASFAAYAAGQMNLVLALWGQLPTVALAVILVLPSALFALAVLFGRYASHRLNPFLAALAFPAFWTAIEFVIATNSSDGTAGALAYSQAGVPEMIQAAALFGIPAITFLLTLIPSLLAMALRTPMRQARILAGAALILFGVNALFGLYRLGTEPGETVRVTMINSDALNDSAFSSDGTVALRTVHAYISAATAAIKSGTQIVVMPEKLAVIEPAWRYDVLAALQQLADTKKITIVAGFDMRGDTRRNVAIVFRPNQPAFQYYKRRMVPGLEDSFQTGFTHGVFAPGRAVAVCKDMDFAGMIREDASQGIRLMLVPAWDFGADGWAHARMAIMRGVEGGFSIARAARLGFLTASDAEGRIVAGAPSLRAGFVSVSATLPLGPGDTLYVRIGDAFAWLCVALSLALFVLAVLRRRRVGDMDSGPPETPHEQAPSAG